MSAPAITYRGIIATIITATRTIEVNVPATARQFLEGHETRATRTDALALSAGYQHLAAENQRLRAELTAARAGTMGREHAEAMQGARKAIAELNQAAVDFMEVYDQGEGPDGVALRDAMGNAEHWLLCDVKACGERAKVLSKGGAR